MKTKSKKDLQILEKKKNIRTKLLKKRDDLSFLERKNKSLNISKKLSSLAVYKKAKVVMFFVTHGSEVLTRPMIAQAWKDDKVVVAPIADKLKTTLSAAAFSSFKKGLKAGAYGIFEPDPRICAFVSAKEIDAVFVPAIAFDVHGHRIGYGKGYYDSWLKNFAIGKRIGLCYDFQVLKKLPSRAQDLKVSKIVTDKKTINCCSLKKQKHKTRAKLSPC